MNSAHILVVDDNRAMAELVKYILTWWPEEQQYLYKIYTAYDGVQGLKLVREVHPDIILLDLHMPRLDGYEVLKMLRLMESTIPVIIMTAGGQDNLIRGLLTERDAFITKPFKSDLLYQHIQKQLLCCAE